MPFVVYCIFIYLYNVICLEGLQWNPLIVLHYVQLKTNVNMRTEKISDILQGMDVNMEDTIVTLSDKILEIGELTEIKKHVSDTVFTFHVVINVIGVYKGDGWQAIIEENAELLPYISRAMYEIGLDKKGYSPEERRQLTSRYLAECEKIENATGNMWDYGSPDNEGWGVVSRYWEKHLQDYFWK